MRHQPYCVRLSDAWRFLQVLERRPRRPERRQGPRCRFARCADRRDASTHMLRWSLGCAFTGAAAASSAWIVAMAAAIAATCSGGGGGRSGRRAELLTAASCRACGRATVRVGAQHRERRDQHLARFARVDHVVDVPPLGRLVRVLETLRVLLHELGLTHLRIGRGLDLAAEDDAGRARRTHDGDLGRRPRERDVGADRLRVHDDVRAADTRRVMSCTRGTVASQ